MEIQMVDDKNSSSVKGSTPPYTSFQSIKTLCKSLKEHGIPSRIDRSVLTSFSGAVGSQILTALKFLDLTDGDNRPTTRMKSLVESYDTDNWGAVLTEMLKKSYAPLFNIRLETVTSNEFNETFRKAFPAKEAVLKKCTGFFLHAAREANLPVSKYLMINKKPRATIANRKPKPPMSKKSKGNIVHNDIPPPPVNTETPKSQTQILLDILDMDKMDEVEQAAVWTLLRYLKKSDQTA